MKNWMKSASLVLCLATYGFAAAAQTNETATGTQTNRAPEQSAAVSAREEAIRAEVQARLRKLSEALALNDDQKKQGMGILTQLLKDTIQVRKEVNARLADIEETGAPDKTAIKAQVRTKARVDIRTLRKEAHDKIAAMLTEEQKAKFAQLRAKQEAEPIKIE